MVKSIKSRDLTVRVTGDATASAWYYRCPKSDEIVVEIKDPDGHYVCTVTMRIRHPHALTKPEPTT